MKVLVSPISKDEAQIVAQSKADIVDVKNVKEGSLGAQLPLITMEVVELVHQYQKMCSATLGDLPYKPGTAALAALGLVNCKVDYIKAGVYGPKTYQEALDLLAAIVQTVRAISPQTRIVASGYADWRRFDGIAPYPLVSAAKDAGVDVVMVDTAVKDGSTLFDVMSFDEIQRFVQQARDCGLEVALAGSLKETHLPQLAQLAPDIIGVRGAVCEQGNRKAGITAGALSSFLSAVQ